MPFLAGKCRSNSMVASNPPADPPTPTIGQAKSFGFERALRRADFAPLLLAFASVRDAFFCAVRFAAMAAFFMLLPRADQTSSQYRWSATSLLRKATAGEPGALALDAACRQINLRLRRGLASPSEKSIHLNVRMDR